MTREREIEILMMDKCTKSEAEKHLDRGTTVFEDFEEFFDTYMKELGIEEGKIAGYKAMIEKKEPMQDWGIVEDAGKTYYIAYVL